jgi:hypothetical protein
LKSVSFRPGRTPRTIKPWEGGTAVVRLMSAGSLAIRSVQAPSQGSLNEIRMNAACGVFRLRTHFSEP